MPPPLKTPMHPTADLDDSTDTAGSASDLPGVEALLAGTLALMTSYSQAGCDTEVRGAMAAKIARNLGLLGRHQVLTPTFRTVVGTLRERWARVSGEDAQDATRSLSPAQWMQAPGRLQ